MYMTKINYPVCPNCSTKFAGESIQCAKCGFEGEFKNGIPSFTSTVRTNDSWFEPSELEEFADLIENNSIQDAAHHFIANHEFQTEIFNELTEVNRDNWRFLVSNRIQGRCLDLYAGYGRRSFVLSELAQEVWAVDPNLNKLRVLSARDDFSKSSEVYPVHADFDCLPFSNDSFETIVVDFTSLDDKKIRQCLSLLQQYLTSEGNIVLFLDGLTRDLGIPSHLGFETEPQNCPHGMLPITPGKFQSMLSSVNFESVDVFALFPTSQNVKYIFNIESQQSIQALQNQIKTVVSNDFRGRIVNAILRVGNKINALKYLYPSYCVVGQFQGTPSAGEMTEFEDPLLVSGRMRSVVLDYDMDTLNQIYKIPNRGAHRPATERENRILSELQSTDKVITETLPTGELISSRFGTIRRESPAEGEPLKNSYYSDLQSFRRTLETGYEWLVRFQQQFGSDTFTRSPEEIKNDLSFPALDLYPPERNHPVKLFRTPVHGDYLPRNIYVKNDSVVTVIDWEYGSLSGWPVVDGGLLVLNIAKHLFGSVEEGFQNLFCKNNEYARAAETIIREYCDSVGLSYRAFVYYFPSIYLHRINLEWDYDTKYLHSDRYEKHVSRINMMWDSDIQNVIEN